MKSVLLSVFTVIGAFVNAQNYVHQVIVLNEGYYDYSSAQILEPVTIGSYNPTTQSYTQVNTLADMRFASDAIIVGDVYFVAADTKIFKFDLNTHQLLATVDCPGVRNLAYADGKIIATRGEYLVTFDSYLHVYNASDLTLINAFTTANGPQWATQNLVVDGNTVYVAVNNAYEWGNEKGIIGKLDLSNMTYGNEIDLGADGKNPDNMVISEGYIYTVNNKDWSGSSVSKVALDGSLNSTVNIAAASTGCGTSALRDGKIVYQLSLATTLNEFDVVAMNNVGPLAGFDLNYYELAQDPVNGYLYTSETDYFSYGNVYIYDNSNGLLHDFAVGVSPGTIVFDVRSMAGIDEMAEEAVIYPNPAVSQINVVTKEGARLIVSDLSGKDVHSVALAEGQNTVSIDQLNAGTYFFKVLYPDGKVSTKKINKI
ncbi:MAG: T9SS type A sorting domain-containing protein [Bacteroidota bacterium]|jgi:sugar lactone lactonase YvrE